MNSSESFRKISTKVAAALGALALAGCVSAHLVHQDPGFTADRLKKNTITVGGLTSRGPGEEIDPRQAASAVDYLERELKSRRPELTLRKHSALKSQIGDSQIESLLANIGENGELPKDLLPTVSAKSAYLVVIVVSYNTVDRYVTNHTDIRNVYDENRNVTGHISKFHTVAQTKRSVSAEYRVYDTRSGTRVWASESSNSRTRTRTADSPKGYPPAPEFGPAPTVSRVLRSMTSAAVKELPTPASTTAEDSLAEDPKPAADGE